MYILAYKDGHDPAACLLKDGRIIAAAEEERFLGEKHAPARLPVASIRYCLAHAGIAERDVDYVICARLRPWSTLLEVVRYYLSRPPRTTLEWRYFLAHMHVQARGVLGILRGNTGYQRLKRLFPDLPGVLAPFDHHLCHAASAFLFSDFDDALIVTWDGKGEATSLSISRGHGSTITPFLRKGIFDSLGLLYSSATEYLGFTPNDGEYKVMGLAPYGKEGVSLSDFLAPDERAGYRINSAFVLYPLALRNFIRRFGPQRGRDKPVTSAHKDLAFALQDALEQVGLSVARLAQRLTPARKACFAGGVALNVKLNKVLRESGLFDALFVQPAAGDNGLVLGAAGLLYARVTGKRPEALSSLYLGPAYSEAEISEALRKRGINFFQSKSVEEETAALLAAGNIVAWFQGRMEFGPRALGHRSVLAHPGLSHMRDRINEKIKFREEFRPFCPSILEEQAHLILKNAAPSPYMILAFDATDFAKEKMSAVVHVDGTVRPQTVSRSGSPRYRGLLEAFYAKTGIPGVLNTSLNIRGEPIVENPDQAIAFFLKTNVDALVIGDCIALRSAQKPEHFTTLTRETLDTHY